MSSVEPSDPPNGIRILIIVTIARTGCTHLMGLMGQCKELNVKGELFHHTAAVGHLDDGDWVELKAASGGRITDVDSLCEWRSDNPGPTLDALLAAGGDRYLVAKIAPRHLKKPRIKAGILSREDVGYLVLRRCPIESYISSRKAKVNGKYGKVDTTNLRPSLDTAEFLKWAKNTKDWYDWFTKVLRRRRRPVLEITYERHLEHVESREALARVLKELESIGIRGVTVPSQVTEDRERQDREPDYRNRVTNWSEFEASIASRPADAELLAWAVTSA